MMTTHITMWLSGWFLHTVLQSYQTKAKRMYNNEHQPLISIQSSQHGLEFFLFF